MKAFTLAAVLAVLALHVMSMMLPPVLTCTPTATSQIVCVGR